MTSYIFEKLGYNIRNSNAGGIKEGMVGVQQRLQHVVDNKNAIPRDVYRSMIELIELCLINTDIYYGECETCGTVKPREFYFDRYDKKIE